MILTPEGLASKGEKGNPVSSVFFLRLRWGCFLSWLAALRADGLKCGHKLSERPTSPPACQHRAKVHRLVSVGFPVHGLFPYLLVQNFEFRSSVRHSADLCVASDYGRTDGVFVMVYYQLHEKTRVLSPNL